MNANRLKNKKSKDDKFIPNRYMNRKWIEFRNKMLKKKLFERINNEFD